MIYLKFNDAVMELYPKVAEYMCSNGPLESIPTKTQWHASFIFEFSGNETIYYKDRLGNNYQYTDEEKVVLALRAVLI